MLMLSQRAELQRVVATLVSDYANAVKSVTLLPVVKVCQWPSYLGSGIVYLVLHVYVLHLKY